MGSGAIITAVKAREVFSDRGHPGIEARVETADGSISAAICTAGISVGLHEVAFAYDGGEKWHGRGVMRAVNQVTDLIRPALLGLDASCQADIDAAMLALNEGKDGPVVGGNATASVSAAALKAGAVSLGIPLYQHIGGSRATVMPVPAVGVMGGSSRYPTDGTSSSGGKPSHEFVCHGFDSFKEASYAAWYVGDAWFKEAKKRWGYQLQAANGRFTPGPGLVEHDKEFWDVMTEIIIKCGYEGKIGIQVDVAAATYLNHETNMYTGIFSAEPKSRDDMIKLYQWMEENYPFVILEDPLDEIDYEGHAILVNELDTIQIVGDDLFTTNPVRVQEGIDAGAANCVLLKVNQVGTITQAFDMVNLAYRNGYGVMPCSSRGEGSTIADYTVGLCCGHMRGGATGETGNRLLEIEAELGSRAVFPGLNGLKFGRKS
jgi:enolase